MAVAWTVLECLSCTFAFAKKMRKKKTESANLIFKF